MDASLDNLGSRHVNQEHFSAECSGVGPVSERISQIDGQVIASVQQASADDYENAMSAAREAFQKWRVTPAPARGETVRCLGNALRAAKADLARLITIETGK